MYCKSLWIKASAKYVNVNMRGGLELRTADETEGRHDGAEGHQSQTADHQGGADGTGGAEDHHSRVNERYGAEGHHSGGDETGRAADHHGGAEGTEDHHSRAVGAETLGRDRDLGKTETQEKERAYMVSRTEAGNMRSPSIFSLVTTERADS